MRIRIILLLLFISNITFLAHAQEKRPNPLDKLLKDVGHGLLPWAALAIGLVIIAVLADQWYRNRNK